MSVLHSKKWDDFAKKSRQDKEGGTFTPSSGIKQETCFVFAHVKKLAIYT